MRHAIIALSLLSYCGFAQAGRKSEIEKFLRDFYDHPPKLRTPKKASYENLWNPLNSIRPLEEISDPTALPRFLEQIDLKKISSLESIRQLKLEESHLSFSPWSDSYWPLYQGSLGTRYADQDFERAGKGDFRQYQAYVSKPGNSLWEIAEDAPDNDPRLLTLSPAEKYDLLIGDRDSSLTRQVWQSAEVYSPSGENPERWMGLCHGWAPASYLEDRPLHKVEVSAQDGLTKITFFPSDIKGLATLLWSNARVPSRMIGNRCDIKNPERRRGRLVDPECFDTNPAEWHLALVAQLGLKKQSMVIDATFDEEVWNQPVSSYSYDYFNPITRVSTTNLEEAWVNIRDFSRDPFRKYRSPNARYLIGIAIDLEYVNESTPNHDDDHPENDSKGRVRYMYDLELNENRQIIGGEWYLNEHPDFVWTPSTQHTASATGESSLRSSWSGVGPVPQEFSDLAMGARGASKRGQPLGKIVRQLIEMSRTR